MLKRLFPTIARITSDWPPVKWMMVPLVLLFGIAMLAALMRVMVTPE